MKRIVFLLKSFTQLAPTLSPQVVSCILVCFQGIYGCVSNYVFRSLLFLYALFSSLVLQVLSVAVYNHYKRIYHASLKKGLVFNCPISNLCSCPCNYNYQCSRYCPNRFLFCPCTFFYELNFCMISLDQEQNQV